MTKNTIFNLNPIWIALFKFNKDMRPGLLGAVFEMG
jgi:hypothetical protein